MWTLENPPRYDRGKLRYPDLMDAEWTLIGPLILPAKPGDNRRTVARVKADVWRLGAARAGTGFRGASSRCLGDPRRLLAGSKSVALTSCLSSEPRSATQAPSSA